MCWGWDALGADDGMATTILDMIGYGHWNTARSSSFSAARNKCFESVENTCPTKSDAERCFPRPEVSSNLSPAQPAIECQVLPNGESQSWELTMKPRRAILSRVHCQGILLTEGLRLGGLVVPFQRSPVSTTCRMIHDNSEKSNSCDPTFCSLLPRIWPLGESKLAINRNSSPNSTPNPVFG